MPLGFGKVTFMFTTEVGGGWDIQFQSVLATDTGAGCIGRGGKLSVEVGTSEFLRGSREPVADDDWYAVETLLL